MSESDYKNATRGVIAMLLRQSCHSHTAGHSRSWRDAIYYGIVKEQVRVYHEYHDGQLEKYHYEVSWKEETSIEKTQSLCKWLVVWKKLFVSIDVEATDNTKLCSRTDKCTVERGSRVVGVRHCSV